MILDPPPLDEMDRAVLGALREDRGRLTEDVGISLSLPAGRHRSTILSRRIRYLERYGLAARLKGMSPIAWVRTAKGTAAMAGGNA